MNEPEGIAMSDDAVELRESDDGAREVGSSEVELTIVTLRFDATDDAALFAVLSKYIVLTRMQDGCRNVDLCSSVTVPGRHLVVQKWETPAHQRRHFDSETMIDMARSCDGILAGPPDIDLWDATSAHDLR
jgi:quinol monooxygenase YgiN